MEAQVLTFHQVYEINKRKSLWVVDCSRFLSRVLNLSKGLEQRWANYGQQGSHTYIDSAYLESVLK